MLIATGYLLLACMIIVLAQSCGYLIFYFFYTVLKICIITVVESLSYCLHMLDKFVVCKSPVVGMVIVDFDFNLSAIILKSIFA
jgi:hypothetical protein